MAVRVRQIIDNAKMRHWSLNSVQMPDGASLNHLNELQRTILLVLIDQWEAILSESVEILTALENAVLMAADEDGAPYFTTTREPGYAIKLADGVPYIDLSEPFVIDPFGEQGDVPGLPLPVDVLRLMLVRAKMDDDRVLKVDVFDELTAASLGSTRNLRSFINGNRLVPIRDGTNDNWTRVQSLQVSFVSNPTLSTLESEVLVPTPCVSALTAGLAVFLATAARDCPASDKKLLAGQYADAMQLLEDSAAELLNSMVSNQRIFRR